jgi:hypothetical protein
MKINEAHTLSKNLFSLFIKSNKPKGEYIKIYQNSFHIKENGLELKIHNLAMLEEFDDHLQITNIFR